MRRCPRPQAKQATVSIESIARQTLRPYNTQTMMLGPAGPALCAATCCKLGTRYDSSWSKQQDYMPDSPSPERFKPEMPQIPGVSGSVPSPASNTNKTALVVAGLVAAAVILIFGGRWALRPKQAEPIAAAPPQIEVPAPAPDPLAALPHANEAEPSIATVGEMSQPWSTKEFFFQNSVTGRDVPALLVRLPSGSATQANSYWAFAKNAPFGDCALEYITDFTKLRNDYGYRSAKHPMVGNPCSRTVFDPLRISNLPGNVWVRGAIVQGSDLRPPLGIEVKIQGKRILAVRME